MKRLCSAVCVVIVALAAHHAPRGNGVLAQARPLRIIAFGAHSDDAELKASGVAAVVVVAPFFTPDTPPTQRNPIFLYYSDAFQDPKPFNPTIVVGIDDVADKKWRCISAMPSQFGDKDSWQGRTLPNVPDGDREREAYLLDIVKKRNEDVANQYRDRLIALYGREAGQKVKYAEAFQLTQYGRQVSVDELKRLFPMPH